MCLKYTFPIDPELGIRKAQFEFLSVKHLYDNISSDQDDFWLAYFGAGRGLLYILLKQSYIQLEFTTNTSLVDIHNNRGINIGGFHTMQHQDDQKIP